MPPSVRLLLQQIYQELPPLIKDSGDLSDMRLVLA